MRLYLLSSVALAILLPSTAQSAIVMLEDFEDNIFNFTTTKTLFHDGNNDYYTIVPLNGNPNPAEYSGFGGSNYFALEDIDDGSSNPADATSTMTFTVGISGLTDLTFSGLFAVSGNRLAIDPFDNDGSGTGDHDFLTVTAQIDGGAVQNLFAFAAPLGTNGSFFVDSDFNGVGGNAGESVATANFADQAVNNLAIIGTGNNLVIEIATRANDSNTEMAFDNIRVDGVSAVPEPTSLGAYAIIGLAVVIRRRRR